METDLKSEAVFFVNRTIRAKNGIITAAYQVFSPQNRQSPHTSHGLVQDRRAYRETRFFGIGAMVSTYRTLFLSTD